MNLFSEVTDTHTEDYTEDYTEEDESEYSEEEYSSEDEESEMDNQVTFYQLSLKIILYTTTTFFNKNAFQ